MKNTIKNDRKKYNKYYNSNNNLINYNDYNNLNDSNDHIIAPHPNSYHDYHHSYHNHHHSHHYKYKNNKINNNKKYSKERFYKNNKKNDYYNKYNNYEFYYYNNHNHNKHHYHHNNYNNNNNLKYNSYNNKKNKNNKNKYIKKRTRSRTNSYHKYKRSRSLLLKSSLSSSSQSSSSSSSSNSDHSYDYEKGAFKGDIGDILNNKYIIENELGKGTFGIVFQCKLSNDSNNKVAIKIIRNVNKYKDAAIIESNILNEIYNKKPDNKYLNGKKRIINIIELFEYNNHVCLVFEKASFSLYQILKKTHHCRFPLSLIGIISLQLIEGLSYLHSMNIIHTDLKCENILFVDDIFGYLSPDTDQIMDKRRYYPQFPRNSLIKIIDFGSAIIDKNNDNELHRKNHLINTRQYRSPEVILNLGWNKSSDLWSLGCILLELYTGYLLFQTHDNMHHLGLIEKCINYFPKWMIRESPDGYEYFHRSNKKSRWREELNSNKKRQIRDMDLLIDILNERNMIQSYKDFIINILKIDPFERISADNSLSYLNHFRQWLSN